MKRRLSLFALLGLAVVLAPGCAHIPIVKRWWKKNPSRVEREGPHVATDTEREFKRRWIDHRTIELVSQGRTEEEARAQATEEFDGKFTATHVAHP